MRPDMLCSHRAPLASSRRAFLAQCGAGFGATALAAMLGGQAQAAGKSLLAPKSPHFTPKAKRVIFLWMQGGASQMDLFDPKPELIKRAGEKVPFRVAANKDRIGENAKLLPPVSKLVQCGESGVWMSEWLPHLSKKVDELAFLKAMESDSSAHPGAIRLMQTGSIQFVRPSMGSWILYGLGTDNENLPGFVVLSPVLYGDDGSPLHYGNAFLPAAYQGVRIGQSHIPIKDSRIGYLGDVRSGGDAQRKRLDLVQKLNQAQVEDLGGDREIEGLIESCELAFRMQAEAPQLFELEKETPETLSLYGIGEGASDNYGRKCLLARRMIEAGVRFVQVTDGGWDHHEGISRNLKASCDRVDKPIAGLLTDLRRRGLLEDTLVVWTGEFGRTPYDQDITNGKGGPETRGRDHNPHCWTMFMAGGGVKTGVVHGATDDFAWEGIEGRVHVHDLHATMLHLLGLDHTRLTYPYAGRDFRLTDVHGRIVKEILA